MQVNKHNFKARASRPFAFQDLNESYPVLAPIRRPGRRQRGGDTIVIHGNETKKSENGEEIDEDESEEEDDIWNDDPDGADEEKDEKKKKEIERIADTPVPPRFTKAPIWT